MSRVDVGDMAASDLIRAPYCDREKCSNGHLWRPETTRWRRRGYRGKHTTTIERDCLVCKAVSEGNRRRRKTIAERNYQ